MEGLTQTTSSVSVPTPPVPVQTPPAAAMATGSLVPSGGSKASLADMLKELNWMEVGFGILGSAALYYTIYYYRYKFDYEKNLGIQVQTDIEDLDDRIAALEDDKKAIGSSQSQSFDGFGFGNGMRAVPTGFNSIF